MMLAVSRTPPAIALIVLLSLGSTAMASSWTVVGTPSTGRRGHQSVLLNDGKVLSFGGSIPHSQGYMQRTATAEVFDPATGLWSSAASMLSARSFHASAKLQNGNILVVGGQTSHPAEVYDVASNLWFPTNNPPPARNVTTASLLNDGKVLMAGGSTFTSALTESQTWLYNPTSNDWAPSANLINSRRDHAATRLPNGNVLLTGGLGKLSGTNEQLLDFTERYSSGVMGHTGDLLRSRSQHTATLLADGRVFVLGGVVEVGVEFAALPEVTHVDGHWTQVAPPQRPRIWGHSATRLLDGRVLVVGGRTAWPEIESTSVEIFDPVTDTWQTAPSMNYARCWHTATLLPDGRVLVDGGAFDGVNPAEIFTP